MAWDPSVYNKFKSERSEPFFDLLSLVRVTNSMQVIDLGCGTGELTAKLARHLPGADLLGIDSSAEMLVEALAFKTDRLRFEQLRIEDIFKKPEKYDLVFSNAALQWADDHQKLIPQIIGKLKDGGQLAIQVPSNHHHFTHTTLAELAGKEPYLSALNKWNRNISVLSPENYAQIFYEHGCKELTVFEKIYPHILKDATAIFDWVSATAILRYSEKLQGALKEQFINDYKARLLYNYKDKSPVFYPFKRILMSAIF